MKQIIFATGNINKLKEVQSLLKNYRVSGSADAGITEDIPETGSTLDENSRQKAEYIWERKNTMCFADDTGLEIPALGGAPGIYSARYAGESKDSEANMQKVLRELNGKEDRSAAFRTVITLIDEEGVRHTFEGVLKGTIIEEKRGHEGFGYDPIFMPEGYDITLAEMSMEEKNRISHRGQAIRRLVDFLNGKQ